MGPTFIQIPKELLAPAEQATFEGDVSVDVLKNGPDLYSFPDSLHWEVEATNTGGAILLQGTVEGVAETSCARCLEKAYIDVFGEIEGYFLIKGEDAVLPNAPEDMEGDEFDVLPEDKRIDLTPLIQAALALEMPLVPLCSEECKGLCPKCGANLNEGDCGCEDDEPIAADNPFAVLADLKLDS